MSDANRSRVFSTGVMATLLLAGSLWAAEEGDPCTIGTAAEDLRVRQHESGGLTLEWESVPQALWYEVMRCDASSGPCDLKSVETSLDTKYVDEEAAGSNHLWYRVFAVIDPDQPIELCGNSFYCHLPFGECAGTGECSMFDEFCNPDHIDRVCGCNGSTYTNACFAGTNGANIRHEDACSP